MAIDTMLFLLMIILVLRGFILYDLNQISTRYLSSFMPLYVISFLQALNNFKVMEVRNLLMLDFGSLWTVMGFIIVSLAPTHLNKMVEPNASIVTLRKRVFLCCFMQMLRRSFGSMLLLQLFTLSIDCRLLFYTTSPHLSYFMDVLRIIPISNPLAAVFFRIYGIIRLTSSPHVVLHVFSWDIAHHTRVFGVTILHLHASTSRAMLNSMNSISLSRHLALLRRVKNWTLRPSMKILMDIRLRHPLLLRRLHLHHVPAAFQPWISHPHRLIFRITPYLHLRCPLRRLQSRLNRIPLLRMYHDPRTLW